MLYFRSWWRLFFCVFKMCIWHLKIKILPPYKLSPKDENLRCGRRNVGLLTGGKSQQVHPGRLTWNLQNTHLERKMIFQTPMIMFHVNLPGCNIPTIGSPLFFSFIPELFQPLKGPVSSTTTQHSVRWHARNSGSSLWRHPMVFLPFFVAFIFASPMKEPQMARYGWHCYFIYCTLLSENRKPSSEGFLGQGVVFAEALPTTPKVWWRKPQPGRTY